MKLRKRGDGSDREARATSHPHRAWETHPDQGGDEEEFKLVNKAYNEVCRERGINK
ncbi:hypothetical protein ES703_06152 [subsurface metagenome]